MSDAFAALSTRTRALLKRNGIESLEALCGLSWRTIRGLPGCGSKSGAELDQLLKQHGLIYRTDKPDDTLVRFFEELAPIQAAMGDFRSLGERYGVEADLMYQIFAGLERATRHHQQALASHNRWRAQFSEGGDQP